MAVLKKMALNFRLLTGSVAIFLLGFLASSGNFQLCALSPLRMNCSLLIFAKRLNVSMFVPTNMSG